MATPRAGGDNNASPPPSCVPAPDSPKLVSFPSSDVPIRAVTVFCKNKAEVTRVVNFPSPGLGRHEVGCVPVQAARDRRLDTDQASEGQCGHRNANTQGCFEDVLMIWLWYRCGQLS